MVERFGLPKPLQKAEGAANGTTSKETSKEKELLGQLFNHPVLRKIAADHNVTIISRPNQASDLDIAFLTKGRKGTLAGIPIFGLDTCVGVALVPDKSKLPGKEKSLHTVPSLQTIFQRDGDVAIMTVPDLKKWLAFLDYLAESDLYTKNGPKIFSSAGLNRSTEQRYQDTATDFQGLFNPATPYMRRRRVKSIQETNAETANNFQSHLDLAFIKKDGKSVAFVPLSHVKVAQLLDNTILKESVLDEQVLVPGVIVINTFENKREAYSRAKKAEEYYQKRYNRNHKKKARVVVPVASAGQLNLWKKLGYEGSVEAYLDGKVQLQTEELVRFLFIGEDSLKQGELARLNFSLPGNIEAMLSTTSSPTHEEESVFSRADLVFFKRDRFGQRVMTTLEKPILGIDFNALKKGKRAFKPISHIGGMVIVPDDATAEEMKTHIEPIQKLFEHHRGDPTAHLLCVTRWLYDEWVAYGSIFVSDTEMAEEAKQSIGRRVEYGTGSTSSQQVYYLRQQPASVIGGATTGVYEHNPKEKTTVGHMFDMGGLFGQGGLSKSQTGLTGAPSTALGVLPHLQSGEIPMIPGLLDTEYLLKSIIDSPAITENNPDDVVSSFIRAELLRNMGMGDLQAMLGEPMAATIASLGEDDLLKWGQQWAIAHWLLQHPHADHHQMASYAHRDMTILARTESGAIIEALSHQTPSWRNKLNMVSLIAHPKVKNRYETIPRPIKLIHSNEQIIHISPNIQYQSVLVDHSIPGAGAQSIRTQNSHLINPGDIRPGPFTDAFLGRFEKQADVLLLETTNHPDTRKASAGATEKDVGRNLTEAMRRSSGKLVVVAAPKNHPERLAAIIEAAERNGRTVAVSDKHANIINQLILAKSQAPSIVDGFNHFTPHIGSQVGLWLRKREKERPYIKALRAVAQDGEMGIVDERVLSEDSDKWVIVVDPWEYLQYNFGRTVLKKGLSYIWSSYYTYDVDSKRIFGANAAWLKQQARLFTNKDFTYFADFTARGNSVVHQPTHEEMVFHASGHGTFSFMADLAATLTNPSGATVILVHGKQPTSYARSLREYWEKQEREAAQTSAELAKIIGPKHPSKLKIIHKLATYDPVEPLNPNNPLGLSGFIHKL